jgi:hypothetical protein
LYPIELNGFPVKVRENLFYALQEMRAHAITTLWVDALCINQGDQGERGRQVKRIRSVYQVADRVAVWLGPERDGPSWVVHPSGRFLGLE